MLWEVSVWRPGGGFSEMENVSPGPGRRGFPRRRHRAWRARTDICMKSRVASFLWLGPSPGRSGNVSLPWLQDFKQRAARAGRRGPRPSFALSRSAPAPPYLPGIPGPYGPGSGTLDPRRAAGTPVLC